MLPAAAGPLLVLHQQLSGKARGSASRCLRLSHQEKKQTKITHQNSHKPTQSDGRASVLGVPSKTFQVGPRAPITAPAMKAKLLLFIAKWPFHEKFGGVSRSLGFDSSLEGAETSSKAGSNVSQGSGLGRGIFWDPGRANGVICGTSISPGTPGASRGKADFWGHQQQ